LGAAMAPTRLLQLLFGLAIAVSLSACVTPQFAAPPTAEVRSELGKIAVVAVPFEITNYAERPLSGAGRAAVSGFGQGFFGSIAGGLQSTDQYGLGLALGIILAPVAGTVGGVVGAVKSHPEREVDEADTALRVVFDEARLERELQQHILSVAEQKMQNLTAGPSAREAAGYRHLADEGFDSVLEITISGFAVMLDGRIDPDIRFNLLVDARLLLTGSDAELYRARWSYWSDSKGYFKLAADRGKLMRSELEKANGDIAERIVNELFVSDTPQRIIETAFAGPTAQRRAITIRIRPPNAMAPP